MNCSRSAWLALCAVAMSGAGIAAEGWPDNFTARLEALALLQTLNADLLSHDSATLTLERWCESHQLATPAHMIAQRVSGVEPSADDELRRTLQLGPTDLIRYRRVKLFCGGVELSEADNWYVPSRLTSEMNSLLDSSDTPFGKVVGALHFQRHTISATLLWTPLPSGWEMGAALPTSHSARLEVPPKVLEHRAVLALPDGTPISAVVETYTGNNFAFAPPEHSNNMSSRR
jgi:hypothetical protein